MKRFAFKLESALKHRIRLEEQAVQQLAAWRRRHAEFQNQLGRLREYRARIEAEAAEVEGDIPVSVLQILDQHLQWLADQEDVCIRELATLALRVEEARLAVVAASTARRSLERLKERQLAEHLAEQAAEEQKQLDDYASLQTARAHTPVGASL
ncbi:MAG: flagellar export protein FliJ [Armatimonadota bacterium]